VKFFLVGFVLIISFFVCSAQNVEVDRVGTEKPDSRLKIMVVPKPKYPRSDTGTVCIQGAVTLRVQFRYNGTIGKISTIKGLPYGATENAIEAAKMIQFLPEIKDGFYVTVSKPVSFRFSIY